MPPDSIVRLIPFLLSPKAAYLTGLAISQQDCSEVNGMDVFDDPVRFLLLLWATPGVIVAVAFLCVGIDRIDHAAQGAYAFRPLLIPGIVLLWPLVVWRWAVLARVREG